MPGRKSGEAGSQQLHFEIRKGSTPVDPLKFLNGRKLEHQKHVDIESTSWPGLSRP